MVIVVLNIAILIHELGHLLVAKKVGIPVARFSIGMGPRLLTKQIGDTEYVLSAIPLGGYVLPQVEKGEDFFRFSVIKRIAFNLGGPTANLLLVLGVLAVANIMEEGLTLTGILVTPWRQAAVLIGSMIETIPALFQKPDQLSGIVGIVYEGGKLMQAGLAGFLWLSAFLSANLAVINLLPFPVLDGGQILLTALEKVTPKVTAVRLPLAAVSWMALLGFMIYITVLDIGRLV